MTTRTVWIVNPYDRILGEQETQARYGTLAQELLDKGHKVVWWTSDFCHGSKSKRKQILPTNPNITIKYIPVSPYNRNIGVKRLWNCYQFGQKFFRAALQENTPDVILASLPPIESALKAVNLGLLKNIPVIVDVQDIWPEAFLLPAPKPFKPLAKTLLSPYFRAATKAYSGASAISGVSPQYVNLALSKRDGVGAPSHVAYLGYDKHVFDQTPSKKNDELRRVIFAGTLGHTYDVETMIRSSAELCRAFEDVEVIIAGDGPLAEQAKRLAKELQIPRITFTGRVPFHEVVAWLKSSVIGINGYADGAPQSFTNKICEYAGSNLAIVNSLPDGVDTFITENKIGLNYKAGDFEDLTKQMSRLLVDSELLNQCRTNAQTTANSLFDRKTVYSNFADFILKQI
jgi:glycosyltransferase involved in cell wall biosynthesis